MEFHKKDAIYLQIADLMCERILRGTWPENERIPSVRELAVSLEVNPNTVMRTYAYLQEHDARKQKYLCADTYLVYEEERDQNNQAQEEVDYPGQHGGEGKYLPREIYLHHKIGVILDAQHGPVY